MKKTLRSIALAALALPLVASAQFKLEEVWVNGVVDGVANPIPGIDAGWTKPVPGNPGTATCSRFAVGKDGKILTTKHNENAIVAWDGENFSTFAHLPQVTAEKWNGTAITTDDAGNVIFNFCFTDATKSVTEWGVINETGTITEVTVPAAEFTALGASGRLDDISHIVGDVNSEKGGIGYATVQNTDKVIMFHFKGDGQKVTSVSAKASVPVEQITMTTPNAGLALNIPSAKYVNIDDILASKAPENEFYVPFGGFGDVSEFAAVNGFLAAVENDYFSPLMGIGNASYLASARFDLGGKKYIVREYVDNSVWTGHSLFRSVMTVGVFDLATSQCVASWMGSRYENYNGMASLSVELVDEHTVNIYTYACTGTPDDNGPTVAGCYAAMLKFTDGNGGETPVDPDVQDGTEAHPYLIATAEDLCNAYKKTVVGKLVYFKQTADIDMAGVTDYTTLVGFDAAYGKSICYDGDNHVIKNFAPVDRIAGVGENAYYDTSIFGTPSGTIKNLGVVDAKIETAWFEAGILGGFAGTSSHSATTEMNIENVFVTGKIDAQNVATIAGGMFGTQGQPLNITDSYVQVEINGESYAAGFISKATAATTVTNSYASATVKGATTALAVATDAAAPAAITFNNVVAFGEGQAANVATTGAATVVAAGDAQGIATVQGWSAFNAGKLYNGLPALNWQNESAGINDIMLDDQNAPAEYYNLQGVRVNNPENGIYIVRRGNKVTKELVR